MIIIPVPLSRECQQGITSVRGIRGTQVVNAPDCLLLNTNCARVQAHSRDHSSCGPTSYSASLEFILGGCCPERPNCRFLQLPMLAMEGHGMDQLFDRASLDNLCWQSCIAAAKHGLRKKEQHIRMPKTTADSGPRKAGEQRRVWKACSKLARIHLQSHAALHQILGRSLTGLHVLGDEDRVAQNIAGPVVACFVRAVFVGHGFSHRYYRQSVLFGTRQRMSLQATRCAALDAGIRLLAQFQVFHILERIAVLV